MNHTSNTVSEEQNLSDARQLADAILRLDGHSAQLRLVHSGALRDGAFDLARLQLIRGHLADIKNIVEYALPASNLLTPTFTIEAPAPEPEKEQP